jgi:type III secretion system FlhB-like substrate exporter
MQGMSTKRVIGIAYDPDKGAPTVVLKGAGSDAEALLSEAKGNASVPVIHAPALAEQLYRTPVDGAIGRELFPVMAALLAHVLEACRFIEERRG